MPGLPATKVIHRGFSTAHQGVSANAMTGRCDITRPPTGRGTLNDTTGTVTNPATAVATDIACRVTAKTGDDRSTTTGEQLVTYRRYDVALATTLDVRTDDIVTVTEANDPHLVGRSLRVTDVQYATETWQRTCTCIDDLG